MDPEATEQQCSQVPEVGLAGGRVTGFMGH
jgi:hypothetical protein